VGGVRGCRRGGEGGSGCVVGGVSGSRQAAPLRAPLRQGFAVRPALRAAVVRCARGRAVAARVRGALRGSRRWSGVEAIRTRYSKFIISRSSSSPAILSSLLNFFFIYLFSVSFSIYCMVNLSFYLNTSKSARALQRSI
jgi:hypothetical protein